VKEAAMKEIIKVAEMLERYPTGVCNALCHEQSNTRAERINGKIQEVKTIGRGYRKLQISNSFPLWRYSRPRSTTFVIGPKK